MGLVTNEARDFFFFIPLQMEQTPFDLSNVALDFPEVVSRNLNDRIDRKSIEKHTGLNRKQAARVLASAVKKFAIASDRKSRTLTSPLSPGEVKVLECALRVMVARPAFTDDSLFQDFGFVLEKNKLIKSEEKPLLEGIKEAMALFVIAAMHGVTLTFEDGRSADLIAGVDGTPDALLHVDASLPYQPKIPLVGDGQLFVAAPMFTTKLKSAQWCVPELIDLLSGTNWRGTAIEMTPEIKLASL
jgi:hypothetical protein